jgi:hypothetical protein
MSQHAVSRQGTKKLTGNAFKTKPFVQPRPISFQLVFSSALGQETIDQRYTMGRLFKSAKTVGLRSIFGRTDVLLPIRGRMPPTKFRDSNRIENKPIGGTCTL